MQELRKAIEILDKLSFFGGQRAGRELWNDKPREVQDEDIATFNRDIEYLRDVIRKHMNDEPCGECSRRKFYQAGYRDGKIDGWIPVEELPPEDDREYCTRYQIMTKYGVTEGWYQPDGNVWYVLLWRHLCENGEIDFEKGDIPTLELIDPEIRTDIISAWCPLPGPYRLERSEGE